jgi:hypothetical protein
MTNSITYKWVDSWAKIPDSESARGNGRTHGVAVTRDGHVVVFHQAVNGLLTYDSGGRLLSSVGGERWLGAHGLTLIEENDTEYLWLVDQKSCEAAKVTLAGETVMTLPKPDHPVYAGGGKYTPTWAAQNPENGEIWLTDGYGSSLVHRYTPGGEYAGTLDGTEGAGRFSTPHGIRMRTGRNGPELWIADRANRRIVIYDGNGVYLRRFDGVHSPCGFDFRGDLVVVPELFTGVKVLHAEELRLVAEIGANPAVGPDSKPEGWPNLHGTGLVKPGVFNSPHDAAFGPDGSIYCVEWIIGGRITRLKPD